MAHDPRQADERLDRHTTDPCVRARLDAVAADLRPA
jgi:hypothetical protein